MSMVDIAVKTKGKMPMKSHPTTATKVKTTTMVKTTTTMKLVKKNGEMVMKRCPITMTNERNVRKLFDKMNVRDFQMNLENCNHIVVWMLGSSP